MSKEFTEEQALKARVLIEFIEVTKNGMTKPYDPTPFLRKLKSLEDDGIDISGLEVCCPTSAEINDAKDFKPYIEAALEEFASIMNIKVNKRKYDY